MKCVICANDKGIKAFPEAYPVCDECALRIGAKAVESSFRKSSKP